MNLRARLASLDALREASLSASSRKLSIALVLWSGSYGGAETWSIALSHALAKRGAKTGLVIVGHPEPLCGDRAAALPREALRLPRGAAVLLHPKALAAAITKIGTDAVIVPSAGYLSAAIRLGGYRGKIIAVEHGTVLQLRNLSIARRALRHLDMLSGLWAVDAQVAPSEYMKRELRKVAYREPLVRIYPGLEVTAYQASPATPQSLPEDTNRMIVGVAGRLIKGKGVNVVLRALGHLGPAGRIRLRIAGEGPERLHLEELARTLGVVNAVTFLGWVRDISMFWRGCDIAVVPSDGTESFGMVAVEAMASGLPVIAARNGGLAEVVTDGENGALFEPGNWRDLANLLSQYCANSDLRRRQGVAARRRFLGTFDIDRCAEEFETFIQGLA